MPSVDEIIEDSEQKVTEQVKLFASEAGKYVGLIIFGIISAISAGNEIANTELMSLVLAIPISIFIIIIYILLWNNRQNTKKRKTALKSVAIVLNKMQDQITAQEDMLTGKISALEGNTDAAIYEMDIGTGTFIHVNKNFIRMFGWEKDELNSVLQSHPFSERATVMSNLMIHEDFQELISKRLQRRFEGDTDYSPLKNVWCKHKDGKEFPIDLQVDMIKKGDTNIIQGYITNIAETRSLNERLDALEGVVRDVVGLYSKRQQRYTEIIRFTNLIKSKIRTEIKNE